MKLDEPLKRHLMGKLPTHSATKTLHENFKGMSREALFFVLHKEGMLSEKFLPTKKSLDSGLVDTCGKYVVWNLENLEKFLEGAQFKAERAYVNQNIVKTAEPSFVGLNTIATYFNVSAQEIGKWLSALGYRDSKTKLPNDTAIRSGLAQITEMNATTNGKKKRQIGVWELSLTQELLVSHGHPLDFSYDKTLVGVGKNSDVSVTSLDERVESFTREFVENFKSATERKKLPLLVSKTPKGILLKAEEKMKKPGFITTGEYKNYIR